MSNKIKPMMAPENLMDNLDELRDKFNNARPNQELSRKQLYTVRQAAAAYPAFTEGSFRWLIFNEKANGFYRCIIRVGRRVLIDRQKFETWLDSQKDAAGK